MSAADHEAALEAAKSIVFQARCADDSAAWGRQRYSIEARHLDALVGLLQHPDDAAIMTPEQLQDALEMETQRDVYDSHAAVVGLLQQAEQRAERGCEFGCGPEPDDGQYVGGPGYGLVPACPVHGWMTAVFDGVRSAAEVQTALGPEEVVVNDQRYVREETLFAAMREQEAAVARAELAEQERDRLSAIGQKDADKLLEFLHRAKDAEARVRVLEAALRGLESSIFAYFSDDVELPEPVMYDEVEASLRSARAALAAATAPPEPSLPCGHPVSAVVTGGEGTSYCGECAATPPEEVSEPGKGKGSAVRFGNPQESLRAPDASLGSLTSPAAAPPSETPE